MYTIFWQSSNITIFTTVANI